VEHEGLSFLSQLVATLIGVGVGGALAFLVNREIHERDRKRTRNDTIDALVDELENNQKGVLSLKNDIHWNDSDKNFYGKWGLASDSFFSSARDSGNLLLIPLKLQNPLNEIYQHFEMLNSFVKQIIEFSTYKYPDARIDEEAYRLQKRLEEQVDELIHLLKKCIDNLKAVKK